MKLGLYSYWRSSCSYRVRIALNIKQIPFEYKTIDLLARIKNPVATDFDDKNPMGQVPVLEVLDNNKTTYLSQSLPIIEFIEESYPGKYLLLPKDNLLRQKARAMAEVINSGIQPLQNLVILQELDKLGGDRNEWARRVINKGFKAFEKLLEESAGKFCIGDEVTIVDLFLIPQIYNAKRFGVDVSQYKKINEINARCMEMDAFIRASPEKQPDAPPS